MTVEVTYPHIEKKNGDVARLKRFPRFRLSLLIGAHLAYGWSAEEMCRQYPDLTPGEIYSAMAYYHDHREEIEAEIQAEWEQAERDRREAPPSPFVLRMRGQGLLK